MNIQKTYNEDGRLVSLKLHLDCFVNGIHRGDLGKALWPKIPAEVFKAIPSNSTTEVMGYREQDFVVRYDEDIPQSQLQQIQTYWTDMLSDLVEFEEKLKLIEEAREINDSIR